MDEEIDHAIVTLAASSGPTGISMGTIVDRLVDEGFQESAIELRMWAQMESGGLIPIGFVCRTFKAADGARGTIQRRGYELMLSGQHPG